VRDRSRLSVWGKRPGGALSTYGLGRVILHPVAGAEGIAAVGAEQGRVLPLDRHLGFGLATSRLPPPALPLFLRLLLVLVLIILIIIRRVPRLSPTPTNTAA
jgi:hypothetical protein